MCMLRSGIASVCDMQTLVTVEQRIIRSIIETRLVYIYRERERVSERQRERKRASERQRERETDKTKNINAQLLRPDLCIYI